MRHRLIPVSAVFLGIASLCSQAHAQSFNNLWIQFVNDTTNRLPMGPTAVSSANDEIDFDYGDLDRDGYIDLVVARKEPFTTPGKRTNILLMNEHGVLTDRTVQYASNADVAGDQGFRTPTNCRDIKVADVDNDGWLDVITSVVISPGDPKWISHPRVYHNQGNDVQGHWLGLKFENNRIPQLMVGNQPTFANGCSILVGDVTGDGAPELYIVDYDNGDVLDTNDRLLVNDGNGYFTDQTAQRVSSAMTSSNFGTAGRIADINGDGANDIIKSMNAPVVVAYNDPTNVGNLNLVQTPYAASQYNMDAADLNNDGRLDFIASDDGPDHYLFNLGNDALGRVIWSSSQNYKFLSGGDDSVGGNAHIVDLDGDGWADTLHADVDVDIPGCSRRLHVYHNAGGTAGQQVVLREERESAANSSWLGAKGLLAGDLQGTYDVAAFDIDNDGDKDLVIGRCAGTYVFMNTSPPFCQATAHAASKGDGHLSACGQQLWTGQASTLSISGGPSNGVALMLVSTQAGTQAAFGGQVLAPFNFAFTLPLDPSGAIALPVNGGGGTVAGVSIYVQALLAVPATSTVTDITEVVGLQFHS